MGRGTYWSITTTYTEVTGVASGNQEETGREGTRKANYLRTFFKALWQQGSYELRLFLVFELWRERQC